MDELKKSLKVFLIKNASRVAFPLRIGIFVNVFTLN